MTIEFVSNDFSNRSVKERLKQSLENTEILRGAVAFWTIDDYYFGDALINALNHKSSFYCVDVSTPTNFDALLKIHKRLSSKPKFYVHSRKSDSKENLLHSKIIVMDKKDDSTEIWVGSHNFTNNALQGINIESSLIITLDNNERNKSDLTDILKYLYDIKDLSNNKPFDESSYFYFMALQTSDYNNWMHRYFEHLLGFAAAETIEYCRTIEIEGNDLGNLIGSTIIIIGENQKELSEIEKYGKSIIVHAHDDNGIQFFYRADLRARDKIDNKPSKQVEFGKRRIGNKQSMMSRVTLSPEKIVKEQDLIQGGFYVNIEIKESIFHNKNLLVYSNPDFKNLWYSENKKKTLGEHQNKIFTAIDYSKFEKHFLPELIYEILEQRLVRNWVEDYEMEILYYKKKYGQKADKQEYISVFDRRIYIISSFLNRLKNNKLR